VSGGGATVAVSWRPREPPLRPLAVVAVGAPARALARRLLSREGEELARLRGAATADALCVLGPEEHLPWADGVVYLGRDPAAPALLVPTHLETDVPLALLEAAVTRRVEGTPVAVVPAPEMLIAVGAARPLDRGALMAWLEKA